MYKKFFAAVLIVCLCTISFSRPVLASAHYVETATITPTLFFSDNTAYCTVSIQGTDETLYLDSINIELKNSFGVTIVLWADRSSSDNTFYFSDTVAVPKGTYTLYVSGVAIGATMENISGYVTKTYS